MQKILVSPIKFDWKDELKKHNTLLYHHILTEVWINVSATKQCANETQSGRKMIKYEDTL